MEFNGPIKKAKKTQKKKKKKERLTLMLISDNHEDEFNRKG